MTPSFLLGIALLAGYYGHKAAQRRNRNAVAWAVIAFLFPITLVVLWMLGSKPEAVTHVPQEWGRNGVPSASVDD